MVRGHPRGRCDAAVTPRPEPARPAGRVYLRRPSRRRDRHARARREPPMTLHTPLLAGASGVLLATAVATAAPVAARSAPSTFLGPLHTLTRVASTVPGNGDLNPYGVAVVPRTL